MKDKIDFVIPWVDGNDSVWQTERHKYESEDMLKNADNRTVRYRDMGTLRYWFRSIETYAPWVNKIHFITSGHIPNWLNTDNPKLNIVNHKDYIPSEYLPTFSANTIELNLHRINGLADKFVFFNDDVFVINPVKPTDFFRDGRPCDSAIMSPAIMEDKYNMGCITLNNMAIINSYFDKSRVLKKNKKLWFNPKYELKHKIKNYLLLPWNHFSSFYEFHICTSFLKQTYEELWDKEYESLHETCKRRFRNIKLDNNQWLFRDWQLASGCFAPRSTKFGKLYMLDSGLSIKKMIMDKKTSVVCLNDSSFLSDEKFGLVKKRMIKCFEHKCPNKSSFEK